MKCLPGTGFLANFPKQLRQWTSESVASKLLGQYKSHCILYLVPRLTDKCSYLPSSNQLPFSAETIIENNAWAQSKDLQIVESIALTKTSPSEILDLWLREHQKRGDKNILRFRILSLWRHSASQERLHEKDWDNNNINEHFNVEGVSVPSFKLLFYFVLCFFIASSLMFLLISLKFYFCYIDIFYYLIINNFIEFQRQFLKNMFVCSA